MSAGRDAPASDLDRWLRAGPADSDRRYPRNRRNLSLHVNGQPQILTCREASVLAYLLDRPNTLVRRDELLRAVWGNDDYFMGRSLDRTGGPVFISRLRKRLADYPAVRIENVHGVGFVLRQESA